MKKQKITLDDLALMLEIGFRTTQKMLKDMGAELHELMTKDLEDKKSHKDKTN
jgi:hypothetical protein